LPTSAAACDQPGMQRVLLAGFVASAVGVALVLLL
jgi:hypothetical protein